MPPSTPAPAFEDHFGNEEGILSALLEETGEFPEFDVRTTSVRMLGHDTEPAKNPEEPDGDTDPTPPPWERDPEAAQGVREQIRVMASGVLSPPRVPQVPMVDEFGEPDVFLPAFVSAGGETCSRANGNSEGSGAANDGGNGVSKDGPFEINLADESLEDKE